MINHTKSHLQLTTELEFLGFDINTVKFQISLTSRKRKIIEQLSKKIYRLKAVSIRELAKLIGLYVAMFPATFHGQLHYHRLEQFKIRALYGKNMNWNAKISLNKCCKHDISWWIHNIWSDKFTRSLHEKPVDVCLYTDSSKDGWGCSINDSEEGTDGKFSENLIQFSINTKELLAILYSLLSFCDKFCSCHVLVHTDNMTALSCITKKGSRDRVRNEITYQIFDLCFKHDIHLSATFVAGCHNYFADRKSRLYRNPRVEWSLASQTMNFIKSLGDDYEFDVDLFASYLNFKHKIYAAWHRDPSCSYVNAFTINWAVFKRPFIHPPFSLIQHCIKKISDDQVKTALMIIPLWPTKVWFLQILKMCLLKPVILPRKTTQLMTLPWDTSYQHPLATKMRLLLLIYQGSPQSKRFFGYILPPYSSICLEGQYSEEFWTFNKEVGRIWSQT